MQNVHANYRGPGGVGGGRPFLSVLRPANAGRTQQTPIGAVSFTPRAPGAPGTCSGYMTGIGQRIIRLPPSARALAGGGIAGQRIIRLPPAAAAAAPRQPPPQQPVTLQSEPLTPTGSPMVVRTMPKKIVSTPELPVGSKVSHSPAGLGRYFLNVSKIRMPENVSKIR